MRLLLLSYEYPPFRGGAGVYAWELARGLHQLGVHVAVLTADWPGTSSEPEFPSPARVHRFGPPDRAPAEIRQELARVYALERADRVLLADRAAQELVAGMSRRFFPYALTVHGTELWWYFDPAKSPLKRERRERAGRLFDRAQGVLAVSQATADLLLSYRPDLARRVHVVRNGISVERCLLASGPKVESLRSRLGAGGRQVILTVGRIDVDKGQETTLRAFARVARERPETLLVLVGDGPERKRVEELAHRLGVAGRTRFLGTVGDETLSACLELCDVFVLPSRCEQRWEGFGLVFLEANARGKPVVAGAVGGVPEVVEQGRTGLLVDPTREDEVADALLELLGDHELRLRLGGQGRERLVESFSASRMARETRDVLRGLERSVPRATARQWRRNLRTWREGGPGAARAGRRGSRRDLRGALASRTLRWAGALGVGRPRRFDACRECAILTTYFTSKLDPQWQERQPRDSYSYVEPWYESMRDLGLHGRVFHDGLSRRFTRRLSTDRIRFLRVPRGYLHSTNDHRFLVYREFLRSYAAPRVFMTDISDVRLARDPFAMVSGDRLYVGRDEGTLGESTWLRKLAKRIGDERYLDFLDSHDHEQIANAGVLGGEPKLVAGFLDRMLAEFRRIDRPGLNANMMVFNYVAHTQFGDRLCWDACSEFKRYEWNRRDVPFIHK